MIFIVFVIITVYNHSSLHYLYVKSTTIIKSKKVVLFNQWLKILISHDDAKREDEICIAHNQAALIRVDDLVLSITVWILGAEQETNNSCSLLVRDFEYW